MSMQNAQGVVRGVEIIHAYRPSLERFRKALAFAVRDFDSCGISAALDDSLDHIRDAVHSSDCYLRLSVPRERGIIGRAQRGLDIAGLYLADSFRRGKGFDNLESAADAFRASFSGDAGAYADGLYRLEYALETPFRFAETGTLLPPRMAIEQYRDALRDMYASRK